MMLKNSLICKITHKQKICGLQYVSNVKKSGLKVFIINKGNYVNYPHLKEGITLRKYI